MFKNKIEKAKTFVKEHKTEIIVGTISMGAMIALGYKYNENKKELARIINDNKELVKENVVLKEKNNFHIIRVTDLEIAVDKMYDMFTRNLTREESRIVFEMDALKKYIENLDKTVKINQIVNIPNAEKRLNELAIQLKEIMDDKEVADEIAKYFLH